MTSLRSESLGNALAAKVQSLAEPAGAKVRASTLPAALRFGLACVQHTAHSAQHTAHSAQRTAHSASCQYAAHMQWILLQGAKFGALKGGSTAYVQHIPREGKSAQRTAHSAQHIPGLYIPGVKFTPGNVQDLGGLCPSWSVLLTPSRCTNSPPNSFTT